MSDRKLPDYLLERLAQGDMPEEAAREAKERLAREPGGAARLERLRASDSELLAKYPPDAAVKEIARRQRVVVMRLRPSRRIAWFAAPAGALAAAAVLLAVLRPEPNLRGKEETTIKGDAALLVYRNRGVQTDLLRNGDTATAGDLVQVAYIRAKPVYGAILSLDGGGNATLHLPYEGTEAVRLVAKERTLLPRAYRLDAAPKFERFFLVTSERPFAASMVLDAARTLAGSSDDARTDPLPLPSEFAQTSFLVLKGDP